MKRSYNRISVDGDTSTNDTMLVLANGASGIQPNQKESKKVEEALAQVMEDLARQIVRDGEGARKLVTIDVSGAVERRGRHAHRAQHREFAAGQDRHRRLRSQLGPHPLGGRATRACRSIRPRWTSICKACPVCRGGLAADFSEAELKKKLDEPECLIRFVVHGRGKGSARFWTCDLTEKYIEINASYRT